MSNVKDVVIPEGWNLLSVGKVVNRFEDGGTPSRTNTNYFGGEINWLVIDDIKHNIYTTKETITKEGYNKSSAKLFDKGSIILSFGATIGEVGIAQVPLTTKQGIAGIEVNKSLLNNIYFYYYLLTQKEKLNALAVGSTIKEIRPNTIKEKFYISLPKSLQEQEKIADILSTVDVAIEKTDKLIEKYKKIKTGLMEDLFTKGIDVNTGKPHTKFKDSELGKIPESWEVKRMKEINNQMTNGFVGVASPFYVENGGVNYLFGNNVRKNKIELDNVLKISDVFNKTHRKSQLKYGDMLTVQSGHIGTSAIVPENFPSSNCHALIITRFKKDIVNPFFISYYCNSDLGMNRMENIFVGSTIKHINVKDFQDFLIPLPIKEEQERIVEVFTKADNKIEKEEAYKEKLEKIKKGLMNDLLTGKVRVKY